jgi:hypothetical protein
MSDPSASVTGAQSALPRYNVTPYRPDGGFAVSGMGMLISALVLLGAALGFVAHWVSQWFYLILLFPVGIGLALGAVGHRMVKTGRVRNPLLGGLAGFLGGVLAMTMMHYFDYDKARKVVESSDPMFVKVAKMPADERAEFFRMQDIAGEDQEGLERAVAAYNSFPKYMDLQAREGVQLKKATSSSDKGLNLGYYGSYIYWIIEILIVAGITFGMVKGATAEPYCRPCDQWKTPDVLGFFRGDAGSAASAVAAGDLEALRRSDPTSDVTAVRLTAASCASATNQCAVDVKLEQLTTDSNGNVKANALSHATYPVEALVHLKSMFVPAAPSDQANPGTPAST